MFKSLSIKEIFKEYNWENFTKKLALPYVDKE